MKEDRGINNFENGARQRCIPRDKGGKSKQINKGPIPIIIFRCRRRQGISRRDFKNDNMSTAK